MQPYVPHEEAGSYEVFCRESRDFSPDLQEAIWDLHLDDIYSDLTRSGEDVRICMDEGLCYEKHLILHQASGLPQARFFQLFFSAGLLKREEEGYVLYGEGISEAGEFPFALSFASASLEIRCRRTPLPVWGGPWQHLLTLARGIGEKERLPGDPWNAQEKALLPLIRELRQLDWPGGTGEFPVLKAKFLAAGHGSIAARLETLESVPAGKRQKRSQLLLWQLNTQKYEGLWRELFAMLEGSQASYPQDRDPAAPEGLLRDIRTQTQNTMAALGYDGTYPDFTKRGSIQGPCLAQAYGLSYFVWREKYVNFSVQCRERYSDGTVRVDFLCGTQLLRKQERPTDVLGCWFDANGKRLYHTVQAEGISSGTQAAEYAAIAAKRTELKKLTPQERKQAGLEFNGWKLFWNLFLVMGLLFGAVMTLAFVGVLALLCLVDGDLGAFPKLFFQVPWWAIFLFCWVGFGGTMGLIEVLARRK